MANILYNQSFSGRLYTTTELYVPANPASYGPKWVSGSTDLYDSPIIQVVLTGFYVAGSKMYQCTNGEWVDLSECSFGGVSQSSGDAQDLVNTIIKNNKRIYENNLLCARFAGKLTADQRMDLYHLQGRLEARDEALRERALIAQASESYPAGYGQLQPYLQNFMANGGKVGLVISGTAAIIISAVVVAAVGTAAYFAFKAWAEDSKIDVKLSDKMVATLKSKLTKEELEQLYGEIDNMLAKQALKSKLSGGLAGISGLLKWALIGTAAYMIYQKYMNGDRGKLNG